MGLWGQFVTYHNSWFLKVSSSSRSLLPAALLLGQVHEIVEP